MGFPIRRSTDQSLFSAPRSLSQSITSFIASYCQGIHQTPFSRLIRFRRRYHYQILKFLKEQLTTINGWKIEFGQCYKLGKTIFDSNYQKCLVYYSIYDVNLSKKIRQKRVFIKVLFLILFKKISYWWSVSGSNRWPSACKADALPAELTPLDFNVDIKILETNKF